MKDLAIIESEIKGLFMAGSDAINDEMHNLKGSLFDLWSEASDLLKESDDEVVVFNFNELSFSCKDFSAAWKDDLEGYELIFNDGKTAQTQTYTESNRLHVDFGDTYIKRLTEYEDLTDSQNELLDDFVVQVNKLKYHFS